MPFTIAHPAAIFPIYGVAKALPLPAPVIGSISPDVPHFIPFGAKLLDTHSVFAVLWFCLPVSLLIYVGYCAIPTPLVFALWPGTSSARLPIEDTCARLAFFSWYIVIISSFIGVVSHILCDIVTDSNGALILLLPVLQTEISSGASYTLYIYKLLLRCSTILGVIFMALAA